MDNLQKNKLNTIINLFEGNEIRSIWDETIGDYYFSVIDVIGVLTNNDHQKARNYWKWLKNKLNAEGSQLVSNTNQLKMKTPDGKMRKTDTLDTKGILRLIESVPSPRAEPMKIWLANLGSERIDEVFDPEIAIKRAINYYKTRGYSDKWIKSRINGIIDRNKLTDLLKQSGITKNYEYAILTNEIYRSWSGMSANEYKAYKGIRKESLRDNMTSIEVILTDLGEAATRELTIEHKPYGLEQNKKVAKLGGEVAKTARNDLENKLAKTIISNTNSLDYQYIDNEVEMIKDNY